MRLSISFTASTSHLGIGSQVGLPGRPFADVTASMPFHQLFPEIEWLPRMDSNHE
jgi:hypothetical protein